MKISSSSDTVEDAGLIPLLQEIYIGRPFRDKDYGNNDVELFFVINCLPFAAKLRKRFDKKGKVLYWDIMLNYEEVKSASIEQKKVILANSIIDSFEILDQYKYLHLDKLRIQEDAKQYFQALQWI